MSESGSDGNEPHPVRYISVPKAVQLIPKPFTGNPVELREFIQNVEAAYEVVEPLSYDLLFKFVCAKIGGEAKTKLLARTHVSNWRQAKAVLEENYSVRRTLDYYAHKAFNSSQKPNETVSQWGAQVDTMCGDLQRAARKHMEDLAWSSEKREGGGDIVDLLIRACFIQGLYDDRIKTMVKTKGSVNTPMAQLVEVALGEESAIRSERFKKNFPERGPFGNHKSKNVQWVKNEPKEVRVATKGCQRNTMECYRCHKGHLARDCRNLPFSVGEGRVRHVGKQATGLPGQPEVDVPRATKGCQRKTIVFEMS
jgi:hypothetical protein